MIDFHSQLAIIPQVYETATLQDNLEHSGGITISWNAATDAEIPLGAYVTYSGIRYILLEPYAPNKASAIHYRYEPQFKHPQNMLDRVPFWITSLDSIGRTINLYTTSFTGFPNTIIQKLCDFITEYAKTDAFFASTFGTWNYSIENKAIQSFSHAIISVDFDNCSIKSAADRIGDAMGCNVYWDWSTHTIRFVVGTTIQGEAYNCFHVLGGTTNMGKVTMSGLFAAVTQRLTLPDTYPGSIISRASEGSIKLTTNLIFDEIYPKQELFIKEARQRLCYLTDSETGEFIVDHYDANNDPVYKTFAKWYIKLATSKEGASAADWPDYTFDQSLLIQDKPLGILFQIDYTDTDNMSPLVGQEFELTYFPDAKTEYERNDAEATAEHPFEIAAHEYYIAPSAHGNILLPTKSGEGLIPRVGDKVTLVNMALSDTQIALAKQELLAAANEIINAMLTPAGEYTETVLNGQNIAIGQASPFGNTHGPVVTTINLNLDTNVNEVTVGSWTRKTKTGGTVDKLDTVSMSSNDPTTGGEEGLGGNSSKTIDQTMLKPDSLFAASLSNSMDVVACDAAGKVTVATDIYTRIDCYYGTKNVTSACTVAVPSLPPSQDSGTAGSPLTIDIYVTDKASSETKITLIDHSYDLDENKRWLRIHFPQGYDLSQMDYALEQTFNIEHPAYTERTLHFTAQSMRPGVNGIGGPFKSRAFTRTNTDISGITPTGGNYNSPLPTNSTVGTETIVWSDGIPQGTAKLWSTVRTFYQDSTVSSWSNPAQETDTDTQDIEFSPNTTQPNKPTGDPFTNRESQGWYDPKSPNFAGKTMIWRAERKVKNGQWEAGGDWVITRIYGEKGNNGGNTATVMLYKRLAEEPQSWDMPTIKLWYDFAAKKLYTSESGTTEPTSAQLGGWSLTIPNDSTAPIYVTAAIAFSATGRDDIETTEWVSPAHYTENGEPGAHGINSATVFLYQRYAPTTQNPTPAKPSFTVYYKFADGKLYTRSSSTYTEVTYPLDGWYKEIPETNGNPCFIIQAAALSVEDYDEIATSNWGSVTKLVEDGENGANGYNTAIVRLYRRSATALTDNDLPNETLTYTFADATLRNSRGRTSGAGFNNWSQQIPSGDNKLYTIMATAYSREATDDILASSDPYRPNEWSTPIEYGNNGENGLNVSSVMVYKRAASQPGDDDKPDEATYTFATGVLTAVSGGSLNEWSIGIPVHDGNACWVRHATAANSEATDTINASEWSTPAIKLVEDGEPGTPGGNTATVYLYKRSASPISTVGITITLYYKFQKDENNKNLFTDSACTTPFTDQTQEGNGWSPVIPSGTDPIYVTAAIAYSANEYDDLGKNEWVTPVQYTENGAKGINTATVFLYQRSASAPTGTAVSPQQTLYYKFEDGKLYKDAALTQEATKNDGLNGWETKVPTADGNPCYIIQAAALSADDYDAIEVVPAQNKNDWSSVRKLVEDGDNGDNGNYYIDQYGRASGRALSNGVPYGFDSTTGWGDSAPAVNTTYPYIWKRSRLWNPNTNAWADGHGTGDQYWSYVCETGESGVVAFANPSQIIIPCKEDGSVDTPEDSYLSYTVSFALKVGDVTISSGNTSVNGVSLPNGVTSHSTASNAQIIRAWDTATQSGMAMGAIFAVTGTTADGVSHTANVTVALIGTKQGQQGNAGKDAAYISIKGGCKKANNEQLEGSITIFNGTTATTLSTTWESTDIPKDPDTSATPARGLALITINKTTLEPTRLTLTVGAYTFYTNQFYDTYYSEGRANALALAISNVPSNYFICLYSFDAIGNWTQVLLAALANCGSGGIFNQSTGNFPFVFIGYNGLAQGFAVQMMGAHQASHTTDATVYVADGALSIAEYGNMWVGLQNTGIDIEQGTIELRADKVTFQNSAGSLTTPKISIDPTTGTLNAEDGNFSGTVRATNLFHGVVIHGDEDYWYCTKANGGYGFVIGQYYTKAQVKQMTNNNYGQPPLEEDDLPDAFVNSTGTADIVVIPCTGNDTSDVTITLPNASDFDGKLIEIADTRYTQPSGTSYVGTLSVRGVTGGIMKNDFADNQGHNSITLNGNDEHDGGNYRLLSYNSYWVKLRTS